MSEKEVSYEQLEERRLWCAVPVVFILLFIISIYTFSKKNVKEYERTEEVFGNPAYGICAMCLEYNGQR